MITVNKIWRRVASLQTLVAAATWRSSAPRLSRSLTSTQSSSTTPLQRTSTLFSPQAASASAYNWKKTVEDMMPIATGHEHEELVAELEGRNILEMNYPVGSFGTEEAPARVKSVYDKRIVGCPGGEGEDEHDVVWFWLEKGKPHECPVCSQYFMLEVVGPGGPTDGNGADDHR